MLRAIGLPELIVIGLVAGLLFGGKALSSLGKGVGDAVREVRKAGKEFESAKEEVKKPV